MYRYMWHFQFCSSTAYIQCNGHEAPSLKQKAKSVNIFTEYLHFTKWKRHLSLVIFIISWKLSKLQIIDLLVRLIKEELDMGRFRHNEVNFRVTNFPQNVHKICFLKIWITSICNLKIELVTYAPYDVNYFIFTKPLHSSPIWLFTY